MNEALKRARASALAERIQRGAIVRAMRRRAVSATELAEAKQQEREQWAAGDYAAIASEMFWEVGAFLVDRVGIGPGERVLDAACGTGNAAIRAAEAGARVVGVDLTPEMFAAGRRLAAEAGVDVEWVEGDAEALPAEDESFEVALSTFGCMFAPRQRVAARELARVLRPGGRLGVCTWTPESSLADLGRTVIGHLPPAPEFAQSPFLWGSEEHVRGLFDGTGIELEFERQTVEFRFESVEDAVATYETLWGPFVKARESLEPQGRWPAVRAELAETLQRHNVSAGADLVYPGEYLVVVGRQR